MHVNILFDRAVSYNLAAEDRNSACAYPLAVRLKDRSICCVYRQGSSKHSVRQPVDDTNLPGPGRHLVGAPGGV